MLVLLIQFHGFVDGLFGGLLEFNFDLLLVQALILLLLLLLLDHGALLLSLLEGGFDQLVDICAVGKLWKLLCDLRFVEIIQSFLLLV